VNARQQWLREAPHWPNREASRFVHAAGIDWHVQVRGHGPVLLLLHGTGAASSSWRDLLPALARHYTVVAPDLPGHGFSAPLPRSRCSLPGMARALAELMRTLGLAPVYIVGHSAGAALAARMALDGVPTLKAMVWLGAALRPFEGLTGVIAPVLARVLSRSVLLPRIAAWRAGDSAAVQRLIATTGSHLAAGGIEDYRRLLRRPAHVSGALAMMAGWDLAPLSDELPRVAAPVLMLHGAQDRTVPPEQADDAAAQMPAARVERLEGLGHLAHEEDPVLIARRIHRELARHAGP